MTNEELADALTEAMDDHLRAPSAETRQRLDELERVGLWRVRRACRDRDQNGSEMSDQSTVKAVPLTLVE